MMQIDNDFRDLLHQKKSNRLKIVLIVIGTTLILSLTGWGLFVYFNQTTSNDNTYQNDLPKSVPQDESSPVINSSEDAAQEATEQSSDSTSAGTTQNNSNSSTNSNPPSNTKPYDPTKCEHLNVAATNSRQAADQKKITYDNAFAARKNYGYYYDKYGNSVDAQREYNAQEALLSVLQKEWNDALTASNSKYKEYQECRATL